MSRRSPFRGISSKTALIVTALLGAAIAATMFSVGNADQSQARCAGNPRLGDLANGEGTIAILNRDVIVVGDPAAESPVNCAHQRTVTQTGLLRHVASQPGTGTAFVKDVQGADSLVVMTPDGTTEIDAAGEVTQPAWSTDGDLVWSLDMESLNVLSPTSARISTIPAPRSAIGIFSPRFTGTESVAAVIQEAVDGAPAEDDALNNLFEYDLQTQSWSRLTSFEASAEEWNAIRTPLAMPDGSILFIRIQGNVHATGMPSFELWRESEGRAERLRKLPEEMYLAGASGESLLWNISTSDCGDWELFIEQGSELNSLGCGAVAVDPVNLVDPDLVAADEAPADETTSAPVAVVVGDFASRASAKEFAAKLGGERDLVSHSDAPSVVKPGAFALVQRVAPGVDPEAELSALRASVDGVKEVFIAPYQAAPDSATP